MGVNVLHNFWGGMAITTVKGRILLLLISGLLWACGAESNERPAVAKRPWQVVTARVFNDVRDVQILANGVPQAWEKVELSVPDSAVLIALLVEQNDAVKKGDLLASLLTFNRSEGYVPVNLTAPIDGIVTRISYKLQDHISGGSRIIEIKNFNHYTLRVHLTPYQMDYIKKNMPVEIVLDKGRLKAHIYEILRHRNEVLLLTEPVAGLILDEDVFSVEIHGFHLKGSYINERYFNQTDSLSVLLQDSIALNIYAVGKADSLVLIYPPLPDVQFLQIVMDKSVAGITKNIRANEP